MIRGNLYCCNDELRNLQWKCTLYFEIAKFAERNT